LLFDTTSGRASNALMKRVSGSIIAAAVLGFLVAGCHSNQNQNQNQAQNQSQSQPAADPAAANMVPMSSSDSGAGTQNPPPPPPDQASQAPDNSGADQGQPSGQGQNQPGDQYQSQSGDQYQSAPPPEQYGNDYGETEEDASAEAPPPIPEYEQPPAPEPDSIWTPGYWAYAPQGYYWVPGVWVMAPWIGALWTPGYWDFYGRQYYWRPGYWGPHIGFYGGVNYGCGYYGDGYRGGYWRDRHFYYNTAITRVNETVIHNVYIYHVENRFNNSRVSYNGGRGGLMYRPTRQEMAARNERHYAPLAAQQDLVRRAAQNRAQFAAVNHGRPQVAVQNRLTNEMGRVPAARPENVLGATQMPANRTGIGGGTTRRPAPSGNAPHRTIAPRNQIRPAANPQNYRATPEQRPQARPQAQRRSSHPMIPARPDTRPIPQARPQTRPQPQPQRQERPIPESQSRPLPQNQARPQSKPKPKPQPHNQGQPQDQRPQP
jgi:hypothetical protein